MYITSAHWTISPDLPVVTYKGERIFQKVKKDPKQTNKSLGKFKKKTKASHSFIPNVIII